MTNHWQYCRAGAAAVPAAGTRGAHGHEAPLQFSVTPSVTLGPTRVFTPAPALQ